MRHGLLYNTAASIRARVDAPPPASAMFFNTGTGNGQIVYTADDGETWASRSTSFPLSGDGGAVCMPNGTILMTVGTTIIRSPDYGQTWTTAYTLKNPPADSSRVPLFSIMRDTTTNTYIAQVSQNTPSNTTSRAARSTNGTTWSDISRAGAASINLDAMMVGQGKLNYYTKNTSQSGYYNASLSGSWTIYSSTQAGVGQGKPIIFSPTLNKWICYNPNGGSGWFSSTNGNTWTAFTPNLSFSSYRGSMFWSNILNAFVTQGGSGLRTIYVSPDGETWTANTGPVTSSNWYFGDYFETPTALWVLFNTTSAGNFVMRIKSLEDMSLVEVPFTGARPSKGCYYTPPPTP